MKLPIIGITGYHVAPEEGYGGTFRGVAGQGFHVLGHDYIHAVGRAGGVAMGIPVQAMTTCDAILDAVDGLIFSGGEDIDPALYGQHPDERLWTVQPDRDRFELVLLTAALRRQMPVLAICRGLQLLNVLFGGSLYKDNADRPTNETKITHQFNRVPRWYPMHRVQLRSRALQQLYGTEEIQTNSYHHQSVNNVGQGLVVSAVAEDGMVEGLEHPDYPNLLAVQWHPEMMAVHDASGLIPFQWLVNTITAESAKKAR
jgi:putative glutamine amidotransferase